jgi:hypothetical protein
LPPYHDEAFVGATLTRAVSEDDSLTLEHVTR